jgi:hypothetical protein
MRKFKKKRFFFAIILIFTLLIVVTMATAFSQNIVVDVACDNNCLKNDSISDKNFKTPINISSYSDSLESFEHKYGKNKVIPKEIRDFVLISLSFYPELASTNIVFEYKSIKQTMNSRPLLGNLFRSQKNRRYSIIINDNKGKNTGVPISEMSLNVIVGWIGHELGHIVTYEKMSNWQTIAFALKYLMFDEYNRKVERYTDYITINHGLAYPLYDGVEYLLNDKTISDEYKQRMKNNYLSLKEIRCFWESSNSLKNALKSN